MKQKRAASPSSVGKAAIAAETLTSVEMADGPAIFVKFANMEFKQLLSIAQAKQKYSKTVADRN